MKPNNLDLTILQAYRTEPCEWCKGGNYKVNEFTTFYAPKTINTWDAPD